MEARDKVLLVIFQMIEDMNLPYAVLHPDNVDFDLTSLEDFLEMAECSWIKSYYNILNSNKDLISEAIISCIEFMKETDSTHMNKDISEYLKLFPFIK